MPATQTTTKAPTSALDSLQTLLPGLAAVFAIAIAARLLQSLGVLPREINDVILAVLAGLAIRNTVGVPALLQPGIRCALQRVLRLAIILLGGTLSFAAVVQIGAGALGIVVLCIAVALGVTYLVGRTAGVPVRLATLIGLGTAICGNSAIVAAAPVIKAKEEEVSFAVATITLFGTAAVFLYPTIGHLLGMTDGTFGVWAGTAVNDTSQVVATSFAYSPAAGQVATVVKLTRNALMAPVIVVVGLLYARAEARSASNLVGSQIKFFKVFPQFVLGFLALAVLNTLGVFAAFDSLALLPAPLSRLLGDIAKFLIVVALAGVGLGTDLKRMRTIGLRPFYVGFLAASILAVLSLTLVHLVRPA
jgi:uncharacterized integral membrane protein (TIGR00698 family)